MTTNTFARNDLRLDVTEEPEGVRVSWFGRSTARDPGSFLGPILIEALQKGTNGVVLDFRKLEYMNSSTITPVIRMLHEAKKGGKRVKIVFDAKSRWQELSFSALMIFQTDDKRISIEGV